MPLKLGQLKRTPRLPTMVASSLSREIAEGRLKPGDRLPTEHALSETFGVSRNVIREAMARLRSEGLVWSQRGSGAFVAKQSNVSVLKVDADTLRDPGSFASIFELRGMIEVQSGALAAERRSDQDIEELAGFVAEMQSSLYGSVAWIDADLAFHRSVAKATGNTYVVDVIGFLAGRVRESILLTGSHYRTDYMARVTVDEHLAILEAIRAGDAAAAQSSMAYHINQARRRLQLEGDCDPPPGNALAAV